MVGNHRTILGDADNAFRLRTPIRRERKFMGTVRGVLTSALLASAVVAVMGAATAGADSYYVDPWEVFPGKVTPAGPDVVYVSPTVASVGQEVRVNGFCGEPGRESVPADSWQGQVNEIAGVAQMLIGVTLGGAPFDTRYQRTIWLETPAVEGRVPLIERPLNEHRDSSRIRDVGPPDSESGMFFTPTRAGIFPIIVVVQTTATDPLGNQTVDMKKCSGPDLTVR
ncbi:hypothetical protein ACWIGW_16770 [Nocardia brasiliensis]